MIHEPTAAMPRLTFLFVVHDVLEEQVVVTEDHGGVEWWQHCLQQIKLSLQEMPVMDAQAASHTHTHTGYTAPGCKVTTVWQETLLLYTFHHT